MAAKEIRSLNRVNESTGNTEMFYPATTTDAVADRIRQKSLADVLDDLEDNSGAYDISAANNNTKYADLAAALGTNGANVPAAVRKGGMSVKFVLSSDNKYVQYRYMSNSVANADFVNVTNWQGVDDELAVGNHNLPTIDGICKKYDATNNWVGDIIIDSWKNGYMDASNGRVYSSTTRVYSPNYYMVIEGNNYKVSNLTGYLITYYFYNSALEFVSSNRWFQDYNEFTVPATASFLRVSIQKTDASTIDADTFSFAMKVRGQSIIIEKLVNDTHQVLTAARGVSVNVDSSNNVEVAITNGEILACVNGKTYNKYNVNATFNFASSESGFIVIDTLTDTVVKKSSTSSTDIAFLWVLNNGRGVFGQVYLRQLINELKANVSSLGIEVADTKKAVDAITSDGNLAISSLHFNAGYYADDSDRIYPSTTRVYCSEFIKGGAKYFITNNSNNRQIQVIWFDANKQWVSQSYFTNRTTIDSTQHPYFRISIDGVNTTTVYNETIKLFSYSNQSDLFNVVDNINILREWNGLPEFIHAAEDVFDEPYFSNHRVAFKSGQYLFVRKGETIGLRDYSLYSVWLRYKKLDGTIVNINGWRTENYVAHEDGFYRVNMKLISDDIIQENLSALATQLFVDRIDYLREKIKIGTPAKYNFLHKATLTIANHAQSNMQGATANTAFATQLAVLSGYSCIENDVRKTLDGVYVLEHDDDISTYYNNIDGTEITPNTVLISQTNYATLVSDYIAKDGFSHITKLEEQLEVCKSNNTHLICEPKLTSSQDALEIVELCRRYLGYENFALAGFTESMLDGVRAADKDVTLLYVAYQSSYKPNLSKLALSEGNSFVYVDWESVTAPNDQYGYVSYLAEAVSKGVPIGVWTINYHDAIRVAKEYKFKEITSNMFIDTPKGKVDKQYLGISNSFANSDEVVITGGTVVGKTLNMPIGAKIEVTYPAEVLGNVEFEMVFNGKLSITDSWNISHYGNTEYNGGSYKFATQVGPKYSSDGRWPVKFTFEATADTVISVFNFTARIVL